MAVKYGKTKKSVRTRSKGEKPLSVTLHSGAVIATTRGKALKLRVFATAKEALSFKLKRGDQILFGGDKGDKGQDSLDPKIPKSDCYSVNCRLTIEGELDDMETFVEGDCKKPCDCVLYVLEAFGKDWILKGKERVKTKAFAGAARRCKLW